MLTATIPLPPVDSSDRPQTRLGEGELPPPPAHSSEERLATAKAVGYPGAACLTNRGLKREIHACLET
jgi:hypothetical protein